jgi:hypothetical protein
VSAKYAEMGLEAEFEPSSRGRMLRNLLGINRVRDINEAESQALLLAQEAALDLFGSEHRFTAADVSSLHRLWLGPIYGWAGEYRHVNIGKGARSFGEGCFDAFYRGRRLRRYAQGRFADGGRPEVRVGLLQCHNTNGAPPMISGQPR